MVSDISKSFVDYILFCYAYRVIETIRGLLMNRHDWTYLENEICCRRFFQHFVLEHSGLSSSDLMRMLKQEMPHLKETSLRRKISNIKYLSIEAGLDDSLKCASSANYSIDNKNAFCALMREYGLK